VGFGGSTLGGSAPEADFILTLESGFLLNEALIFGREMEEGTCGAGPDKLARISLSSMLLENEGREGDSAAGEVLDRCKADGRASCTVR